MKHFKIFAVLALAVAATMAFASTASATRVTSPAGTLYTSTLKASHEGSHVTLHNPFVAIECTSTLEGTVNNHGVSLTATGPVTSWTFAGCTNGWTVTTNTTGTFEIHTIGSGPDATWTSSGLTITAVNGAVTCRYATNATDIGRITSSTTTGETATLDLSGSIPFHSGSIFCGSAAAVLTGNYRFTTPDSLYFD